jgi:hypothetical protein
MLMTKMAPVERAVRSSDILAVPKKKKVKKFKSKLAIIPSTLTKKTNSVQIQNQYSHCNIAPQLWKMETIIADDCVAKYSHPGIIHLLTYWKWIALLSCVKFWVDAVWPGLMCSCVRFVLRGVAQGGDHEARGAEERKEKGQRGEEEGQGGEAA